MQEPKETIEGVEVLNPEEQYLDESEDGLIRALAIKEYKDRLAQQTFDPEVLKMLNGELADLMEALGRAQLNFKPVLISGYNPLWNAPYSTYEDIRAATDPALRAEKLTLTHLLIKDKVGDAFFLYTILYHTPSKQYLLESFPIYSHLKPEIQEVPDTSYQGGDRGYQQTKKKRVNKSQAIGSEVTYAKRYSIGAILGCSAYTDDDAEAVSEDVEPDKEKPEDKGSKGKTTGDSGGRAQSKSEKSVWATVGELRIDKKRFENTYAKTFRVKDIKDLQPNQWRRISNELSKLKSKAKSVAKFIDVDLKTFVGYVAETSSWHNMEVAMDKVIQKDEEMTKTLAEAVNAWKGKDINADKPDKPEEAKNGGTPEPEAKDKPEPEKPEEVKDEPEPEDPKGKKELNPKVKKDLLDGLNGENGKNGK